MPENPPKSRHSPTIFAARRSRPSNPASSSHRRAKPRSRTVKALSRSASERTLWTVRLFSGGDGETDGGGLRSGGSSGIGDAALLFPRRHTWTDVLSPSLRLRSPTMEGEAKVVVSVTVEGSPGPVRAMVKLGASVGEAIGVVVDEYEKERRSPRIDPAAAGSFQLHYSHFSLQSLDKNDKIGEVGSRSFYLRKSSASSGYNSFDLGRQRGSEIELEDGGSLAVAPIPPTHVIFSFIAKRFSKIRRRTRKLWKVVVCITCG